LNPFHKPVNVFSALDTKPKDEHKELHDSMSNKIIAVFANPAGLDLLDYLDDMYLRQPVVVLGAPDNYAAMREGENKFIRMLRTVVNKAQRQG